MREAELDLAGAVGTRRGEEGEETKVQDRKVGRGDLNPVGMALDLQKS